MEYTVKEARQSKGLSESDAAAVIGVSLSTYIKYENNPGKFSVKQAIRFSSSVGIPIDEIFFTYTSTKSRI